MLWKLATLLVAIQAADPVPPQRVDPQSIPTLASTEPIEPRSGGEQERPQDRVQERRVDRAERGGFRGVQEPPMRIQEAPSIFTDEAYRQARVRSLLQRALEERGW